MSRHLRRQCLSFERILYWAGRAGSVASSHLVVARPLCRMCSVIYDGFQAVLGWLSCTAEVFRGSLSHDIPCSLLGCLVIMHTKMHVVCASLSPSLCVLTWGD